MGKSESRKKAVTVNQVTPLYPDLDSLIFLNLKTLLYWKAEQLHDLGLRIAELSSALNKKYGDFPDYEESHRFYSKLNRSTKNNFTKFPLAACIEFKIITMDELNTFVRKHRIAINITHLQKCFEFAQTVLKIKIKKPHSLLLLSSACSAVSLLYRIIKEPLQEDMLKAFVAIDHSLTSKSNEAIGYWTMELKGKKASKKGGDVKTRLPGLVATIKKFKDKPTKPSVGSFINFLSKKEYTRKTPYQIDQYDLYIDDDLIYHRDRTIKDKKGKSKLTWDRPLQISSLDRYYYEYVK